MVLLQAELALALCTNGSMQSAVKRRHRDVAAASDVNVELYEWSQRGVYICQLQTADKLLL